MKIILTFTLMMIPGVVSSISVTGYSGGGVTITCRYDEGYTAYTKYFCKGQWSECSDQIKTEEKNEWINDGRFSLYDDTRSAVFTVIIRDLREEDSGTYYCGTDIYAKIDLYSEVSLKVVSGQNIWSVTGYSGGNVMINYKYEKKLMNHVKYFCKTATDQCFTPINTDRAAELKQDRRFSVHEDRSAGLLRVFITELNENDSGEYKITVKVSEEYSFFSEFNLNIRDDDCCEKSISLSAAAGGSVNISCKYPQSHRSDVKFLCRRSGADLCAEETSVKESRRWSPEGKIQLYDDREERLLTGRISHVTEQHSEYWCGVQSDQGHKSFITRVFITLTETNEPNTPYPSSSSSSPASVSAETQMISEITLISLDTTSTTSSMTITMIFISEVLALLLIGVPIFLVTIRQNKQTHGLLSDEVSQVSCTFVIVSKTDLHTDLSHTDTRTTAVYSAVHVPMTSHTSSEK